MTNDCFYCGPTDNDVRPYGPGGSTVCYNCAMASPERLAETKRAFYSLLEGAALVGGSVVLADNGPQPYIPRMSNE